MLVAAGLLLLFEASAQADDQGKPDDQAMVQARALLSEANALYAAERYEEARAAYEAAYELTLAPGFLYNIAQSHRLAKQCRSAIEFYEKFLAADPKTPLRGKVEGFVGKMWVCLEREKEAAAAEEALQEDEKGAGELRPDDTESSVVAVPVEAESRKPSRLPLVGLAVGGMGVLGLGTSAYFGLKARSTSNDIESFTAEWGPAQEAKEEAAQRDERLSIILGVAGGTALVGGAVLYFLTRDETSDQSLALQPTAGGATLSYSTSY
jgi:tetratricopeptide (TPR) repeat protein